MYTSVFCVCRLQFSGGYQPTVGVDYGFKIQNVKGEDCKSL